MSVRSKPKVVLITGASRGIGYSLALALAAHGHIVCATFRRSKDAKKFKKTIKKFPNFCTYLIDVTKDASVKKGVRKILADHQKIDVVVNNAAHILFGPLETISVRQLKEQYDVNVFGGIRVVQEVLPSMRKSKSGHIIFMGSTAGVHFSPMYGAYASTKSALESIATSLAANLFPWKIKVSIIENSATRTGLTYKSLKMGERFEGNFNPYKEYIKKSLRFLRDIAQKGQDPDMLAKSIVKVIEHPHRCLRELLTEYSKGVFNEELKDPEGEGWLKKAEEEWKQFGCKLPIKKGKRASCKDGDK